MPNTRPLTPEEADWYQKQGLDPSKIVANEPTPQDQVSRPAMSAPAAALATAKAHAGGYLGGGAGTLATVAGIGAVGLAPETLGGSLLALPFIAGGGALGAYGGQKLQEKIEGENEANTLEQGAQEAAQAHPFVSGATDIAASALLSGGKPNLSNIPKALGGDKDAIAKLALNSIINPAVNTGINYAATGQLPTGKDLLEQAAGGLLFSEQNALGRKFSGEPKGEPTAKIGQTDTPDRYQAAKILSPFLQKDTSAVDYISDQTIKDAYTKAIGPKPQITDLNDPAQYIARSKYEQASKVPLDVMRQKLHDVFMATTSDITAGQQQDDPEMLRLAGGPLATLKQDELSKVATQVTPVQQETQTTNQKADEVARKARQDDYQKALIEKQQQDQMEAGNAGAKYNPITENQARIINPDTLLKDNLNRPTNPIYDEQGQRIFSPDKIPPRSNLPKIEDSSLEMLASNVKDINNYMAFHDILSKQFDNEKDIHKWIKKTPIYNSMSDSQKNIIDNFYSNPKLNSLDKITPKGDTSEEDQLTALMLRRGIKGNKYDQPDHVVYENLRQKFASMVQSGQTHDPLFKSIWTQMEQIKNRNGGMPPKGPPQSLEEHIRSGNATTGSVLQGIVNKENEWSPLAKQMLENASPEKLGDQVLRHKDDKFGSHYDLNRGISYIHDQHLNDNGILLHEMGHSLISKNLPFFNARSGEELSNAMDAYSRMRNANPHVKELISIYKEVAEKLGVSKELFENTHIVKNPSGNGIGYVKGAAGLPDETAKLLQAKIGRKAGYAMGNLHEFTSLALSDPEFQRRLNDMETSGRQSVWTKFANTIRGLLGVDVKHDNMLERMLKVNEKLIGEKRPPHELDEEGNKIYSSRKDSHMDALEELEKLPMSLTKEQAREAVYNITVKHGVRESDGPIRSVEDEIAYQLKKARKYTKLGSPQKIGKEEDIPETKHMGFIGKTFRAGLDTIRSLAHPSAKPTADALQKVFQEHEQILGRQLNPVIEAAQGVSKQGLERLNEAKRYELENKQSAPVSMFKGQAEMNLWKTYKESIKKNYEERLANGEPVNDNGLARLPVRDEFYHPTTSNPKVADILRANTDKKAIEGLKEDWRDYYTQRLGKSPQEADQYFTDYRRALQGSALHSDSSGNQAFFNAARKPQGLPLPPSFERPGFMHNFEAYAHAQAMDNAYYKHVETNPKVMAALGYTRDPWGRPIEPNEQGPISGNTAVRNVLNEIKGESNIGQQGRTISKTESLATATLLGPLTEFHKLASNPFKLAFTYTENPLQMARSVFHATMNIAEGWTHAKENGKIIMTAKTASDMWDTQLTAADRLGAVARGLRQIYTLGDLTDKVNLGFCQAMSEYIIKSKINLANNGDVDSIRLLKHLDPDYTSGKQYAPKESQVLASQLVGVIHGTKDARTMPSWMLHDNEISSFFKLSSWGIAQTNAFMRDVYTPAREGNLKPLIMSAFGAAVGGYLIKELRQDISGKKSQIPSLSELASSSRGLSGNIPAVAYNMMAAASYAGFGGMLSTIGRYPFDMAFKNTPQGATFPLDQVVSDLGVTVSQVGETIANDPNIDWLQLAAKVGQHVIGTDFQLGRVALNHAIDSGAITGPVAERKQLADKLGELRRFYMAEGLPYEDLDASGNPYMNLEQKRFKQTQDVGEAMQMLPGLINSILTKYQGKPDVIMSKLKGLKENEYSTFPNLDTMPLSFMKYMGFLEKEEGPQKAQEALQDYFKHKIVNEAKGSVVP